MAAPELTADQQADLAYWQFDRFAKPTPDRDLLPVLVLAGMLGLLAAALGLLGWLLAGVS
jgi:hypothetical protein